MTTFIIVRTYGKNRDYLKSLQDEWGTVCVGSKTAALSFSSLDAAKCAARKARRACMGWNGSNKVRAHMNFKAVKV